MGRRRLHSLLYLLALVAGIAVFHAFHGNFQNAGGFTQRSSDCEPYCFYNQDDARLSMALDLQKEDRDFTGMDHTSVVVLGENDQPSANSMLKDIARNVEREAAAKDILEVRPSTAVDTQSPLKPKIYQPDIKLTTTTAKPKVNILGNLESQTGQSLEKLMDKTQIGQQSSQRQTPQPTKETPFSEETPTKFSWLNKDSSVKSNGQSGTPLKTLPKSVSLHDGSQVSYDIPASGYDGRFEKPTKDILINIATSSEVNSRIEQLKPANIPFLPNYKNPCWFEAANIDEIYNSNVYSYFKDRDHRIRPAFEKFRDTLKARKQRDGVAWQLRCLPYFYLVGSPRCGTTDFYSKMVAHPEIPHQIGKETVYWNRARYLMPQIVANRAVPPEFKVPLSFRHYIEWFDNPSEEIRATYKRSLGGNWPDHKLILGDFSPSYMYDFDAWYHIPSNGNTGPSHIVADLIKTVNPDAKIIFILREPIERLLSDYTFWSPRSRKSPEQFHQLVEANIKSFKSCQQNHAFRFCLHDRNTHIKQLPIRPRAGLYYPYLKEWLEVFPRNQTLIFRFEEYRDSREDILNKVFEFLGVEKMSAGWFSFIAGQRPKNQSSKSSLQGTIWNSTIALLHEFYDPWNKKLAELLNDKQYLWS